MLEYEFFILNKTNREREEITYFATAFVYVLMLIFGIEFRFTEIAL